MHARQCRRAWRFVAAAIGAAVSVWATFHVAPSHAATPTIEPLTLSVGQFELTDTDYTAATNHLYSTVLTNHANLPQVTTTAITTNSSGATDLWLNLRSMRTCSSLESKALPPVTTKQAWCWSTAYRDHNTYHWFPQGISSTGEADSADGALGPVTALAISWHYQTQPGEVSGGCKTNGMLKITFIDRNTMQYRHVLLVAPTSTSSTASDFGLVTGHGGGIAWYDHYIYVTDTHGGIRVFDISKMAKVTQYGSGVSTIGVSGTSTSACGYAYVLPQTHYYSQPATSCPTTGPTDASRLCYSWISLDKFSGTPYKLVVGEFYGGADSRIVRYLMNPASASTDPSLLATSAGKTIVHDAYTTSGYYGIQGGVSWTESSTLHFALNTDCAKAPAVFSHTWVGDTRNPSVCADGGNWGAGPPEDMSYWPQLGSTAVRELWGLGEGVCRSPSDPLYEPPANPLNACNGYTGSDTGSLRTVYAVGMTDPDVLDLH